MSLRIDSEADGREGARSQQDIPDRLQKQTSVAIRPDVLL